MPIAFFIYLVLCLLVAFIARKSKLGSLRTLLVAFLLTPLVAFIYVLLFAAIDDKSKPFANGPAER
jgi:RsiW-degrading membrane proteinase PrsW (M82 family)